MFKELVKSNRCLTPANGFYEWQRLGGDKMPHYMKPLDAELIYFGGLFRTEKIGEREVLSCAIVITTANQDVSEIHSRMPLIIDEADMQTCLETENIEDVQQVIKSAPDWLLQSYPVSKDVNKPLNDGENLITPF